MGFFSRHEEAGIVHAERLKNSFPEELVERLAAYFSNEKADHIGGDRIVPGFSRRELQRNFCKIFDHRLQRAGFYRFADLRFAAAGAKSTTAHGKLNLPAELGLSWLLPRMIGLTRANELLLTSRVFLAEEALGLGVVNGVLPSEELLPYVYKYTRELIASVSPGSLSETKHQIYTDLHCDVGSSVVASSALTLNAW